MRKLSFFLIVLSIAMSCSKYSPTEQQDDSAYIDSLLDFNEEYQFFNDIIEKQDSLNAAVKKQNAELRRYIACLDSLNEKYDPRRRAVTIEIDSSTMYEGDTVVFRWKK